VDNGWAAFVVFLLGDPHLLEGGEGSQDGSSDPYGIFSFWWSNDLDLNGGHAGYPYANVPFGSSSGLDAITQGLDPVTQGHYYGKREAEAEPEADAQYLASPYTGYNGFNGYNGYAAGYGLGYSGYPYSAAYGYGNLGYAGHGYGLGYRGFYGKREAEAEPQFAAPYAGYGAGYGYGYSGYPYSGAYGYGAGFGYPYNAAVGACRNYLGAPVPC